MVRNIRINLFAVTVALICVGIIMIYSASSIYALDRYKDSLFFVKRHLSFVLFGTLLAFLAMVIDYRKFARYSKPLLLVCIVYCCLFDPRLRQGSFRSPQVVPFQVHQFPAFRAGQSGADRVYSGFYLAQR